MAIWYQRARGCFAKALLGPSMAARHRIAAKGAEFLPEPPFVLMADHANALDPCAIALFSNCPVRFSSNMAGVSTAHSLFSGLVGAYPGRRGASDIEALRMTFGLSRKGEAIGIFPEGDRSWDGASRPIKPGIGRLMARLGLPLVIARQRGNYLAKPRWAKIARRGPWDIEFLAFEADELARMGNALVDAVAARAIEKDEIKDAMRQGRVFAGEGLAEGIGRLLWRCPVCGKVDSIVGQGDGILCSRCQTRWLLDANCRVRPLNAPLSLHAAEIGDLKDWHDWQVATLPETIPFRSEGVTLSRKVGNSLRRFGRGQLCLRGERGEEAELVFISSEARFAFDANSIRGSMDGYDDKYEFEHRGLRWRLDFGGGNAAKWSYALSITESRRDSGEKSGPEGEAA
jgi:1-acyl-sn-glycerol-3-phosphate acyltransferase